MVMLIPISGCATKTGQYGRASRVRWLLTIEQKQGENLRDVTIYVPFPRDDKNLLSELLNGVKSDTNSIYNKPNGPQISYSAVKTRFGEMLKVSISQMNKETGGVSPGGEYVFATVLPIGQASTKYPLEPTIVKGKIEKAPVYIEYTGGTGLYFWLVCEAYTWDAYLPVMPNKFGDKWIIGKSATGSIPGEVPFPSTYLEDRIWLSEQGWNEILVWH